jgi:hypothetical protein
MHKFSNTFVAFSCFAFFGITNAFAESEVHPFLSSKFTIQAGYYYPTQDLRLRVDGSLGGENVEFDFDEQINLPQEDDVFTLEMTWRFGKKWSLRMQHFQENRRHSAVLDADIEWGDTVILAGSSVFAGSNFKLTRAFLGRSLDANPQYDYGLGIGVHRIEIDAFIGEDIMINFGETSSVSATGPLPNIGGWYYYSPSADWYFGGRLDWFQVSIGDYAGGLVNFSAGANYQLFEHFGIGLNYQIFSLNADVKSSNWRGRVESEFRGFSINLSGNW